VAAVDEATRQLGFRLDDRDIERDFAVLDRLLEFDPEYFEDDD